MKWFVSSQLDRLQISYLTLQEALIAEIVEEHAGVEAERREAVTRAENAEAELSDAHRAARIVAIGVHTSTASSGFCLDRFPRSVYHTVCSSYQADR